MEAAAFGQAVVLSLAFDLLAGQGGTVRPPDFRDYPAADKPSGAPASLDIESAGRFRPNADRLRAALREGPNFAGRIAIASWSCGNNCWQVVAVESATGRVVGEVRMNRAVRFRVDSALLV